jgi:hypothetical protein
MGTKRARSNIRRAPGDQGQRRRAPGPAAGGHGRRRRAHEGGRGDGVAGLAGETCRRCGEEASGWQEQVGQAVSSRAAEATERDRQDGEHACRTGACRTGGYDSACTTLRRMPRARQAHRVLEWDIAHLKHQLAARPPLDAVGIPVGSSVGKVSLLPSPAAAKSGLVHGAMCQCAWCRASRRAAWR